MAALADVAVTSATAAGAMPQAPKLVIFDLDGTLVDSSADLVHAVNATLADLGRQPRSEAEIASFIGDGARALVERSLRAASDEPGNDSSGPADRARSVAIASDSRTGGDGEQNAPLTEHEIDRALLFFLDHYREHLLDNTRPYPSVLDTLHTLRAAAPALLMAVLTNKPVNPSRRICEGLGLAPFFFANYGGNSFPTKKPDPEGLQTLWREAEALLGARISPAEIVLIGDSDVDVRTARNAGVRSLGCTWGFATDKLLAATPDTVANHPSEWPAFLGLT